MVTIADGNRNPASSGRPRSPNYSERVSSTPDRAADIDLVLAFLNTIDVEEDTDVLRDRKTWIAWATGRGLDPASLTAARQARTALRAAAGDTTEPAKSTGTPMRVEVNDGRPELVAPTAAAAILVAAARLTVLGEWERIKICPRSDCRWAFHDESRNRSRTWCSMRVCGNRSKSQARRERDRD